MTYQQTLDFLYASLPMFQRVGAVAYKKDLTNTLELCRMLGDPHRKFKSIHVAGTNGKGSTSHMLASVLQSAGYKTGLYTSPHLKSFTERIKINGEEVTEQFVIDFVERIKPHIETLRPSFFEITVAMAFDYFARHPVDIAVIETGLGGRLDSTNVITPVVSVITNIGYDHMDLLGNTLEQIATEKAGIIKQDVPVVISETQPDLAGLFKSVARAHAARIHFADEDITCRRTSTGVMECSVNHVNESFNLPLLGNYQQRNVSGVLKALQVLQSLGYSISLDQIKHGLEHVVTQTGLKGRWQQLGQAPLTVCDTGHNIDGVKMIVEQIETLDYRRLHMVWGMVKDKDREAILNVLPREACYYFCQANIPRALDAHTLANEAMEFMLMGEVVPDVNEALSKARSRASAEDLIFIGGSTFVVAALNEL
ncbi:MAG: bifunctional folylpolyglutamate synthase/dihydrofolate synthase [Cyclobacteriaceae bacterium]|nr:bifunctional folylpolyglutamate synthase/dihydrofolate synthase [Cyclobacteriaceae bacterium]UYN85295.1 MAG: bifunctional folylpolyglutamate synthase/dihydrofolate synthase [Cyclobacteriaceae bacterium]